MSGPDNSIRIQEGGTALLVPEEHSQKGPGKRLGKVFFNAQMAFNRDVSVMLFRSLDLKGRALDAMAATGARGVRIANECPGDFDMVVNDKDPRAYEYIKSNIELNSLGRCSASNEDLRCHLATRVYDYIDIDPFGSPVPFVQACLQGLKRNGVMGLTATDTAPLAGTHAKKCLRRYMARPLRNMFGHETGLRILIGYLAREAAQLDKGVRPLLCFYADHYFRCFLRVEESAAAADASLENLGHLRYDASTHERTLLKEAGPDRHGPLWLGRTHDPEVVGRMTLGEGLQQGVRCAKYLELWRNELDVPFFYENNELSSLLRTSPLEMDDLLARLRSEGRASRTHFSPTGFRTDLPMERVKRLYLDGPS